MFNNTFIKIIILIIFTFSSPVSLAYITNEEASKILMDLTTQKESENLLSIYNEANEIAASYSLLSDELDDYIYSLITAEKINFKKIDDKYINKIKILKNKTLKINYKINNLPNYSKSSFDLFKVYYLNFHDLIKSYSKFYNNYLKIIEDQISSIERGDWKGYDKIMAYSRILKAEQLDKDVNLLKLSISLQTKNSLPGKINKLDIAIVQSIADLLRFESFLVSSEELIEPYKFNNGLNNIKKNFINFEENKRDFYLTVNHFNLGYKEELEAIAPRIFSNKFELILSLSEELVKNADKIRNSILIKLNIYEKNYPYLPDSNDEEIIKFQLDLENEFHEYSNVGQEFQKTFQEIVMLLQGLQGFQN